MARTCGSPAFQRDAGDTRMIQLATTFVIAARPLIACLVVAACTLAASVQAQEATDCLSCHGSESLSTQHDGEIVSLYIDGSRLANSVHGGLTCTNCHTAPALAEYPHGREIPRVDCGHCHDGPLKVYMTSLHGQAVARGDPLAPLCQDCHGNHYMRPLADPASAISPLNVPHLCGQCHKEGTEVQRTRNIPQDQILQHYSESIHGEGLFHQGLLVTAVCTSCHTGHRVLPHTDPQSSISRENIVKTCMHCHGLIEQVHRRVIKGELWQKDPGVIPVCVDCHSPHETRKVYYDAGSANHDCLQCHGQPELAVERGGRTVSLYVNETEFNDSIHGEKAIACAQCHAGTTVSAERPCSTITHRVDCSICHESEPAEFRESIHGTLHARGDPVAPTCVDCHGKHDMQGRTKAGRPNPASPIFPANVPTLCAKCHREGAPAAVRYTGHQTEIVESYTMSIHGKGLLKSGLVVTATCTSCHTAHHELPADDPRSSIHPNNVAETCSHCHQGVYEQFAASIHSPAVSHSHERLPTCVDCHSSHVIKRADQDDFRLIITVQCGRCHRKLTETFFETYHGKVSKLGSARAAKCSDCHGAHNILPPTDPASTLSRANIVETCRKCHPGSHRKFTGYLTHATHHDPNKYPALFFTFWGMTALLLGTLLIASLHTMAWLPRSWRLMTENRLIEAEAERTHERQVVRFDRFSRTLHLMMLLSFMGLAITGMVVKFADMTWARRIADLLGGVEAAGTIHRICAIITFTYFGLHIYDLIRRRRLTKEESFWKWAFGPNSPMFNRNDLREAVASVKWFVGLGPRPNYGRWTYWEKFDYFAVFWGVAIIGTTGLILWKPVWFTWLLPGWVLNVATIIHSDEALLAVGFIFTIHFFNTHGRPDRFPLDPVIFTGRVPLEEFKRDRPREYEELVRTGQLEQRLADPPSHTRLLATRIFGFIALAIGLTLIGLIIYTEVFYYGLR
jgi:cytochrome b subunit of formate dehydrogenase